MLKLFISTVVLFGYMVKAAINFPLISSNKYIAWIRNVPFLCELHNQKKKYCSFIHIGNPFHENTTHNSSNSSISRPLQMLTNIFNKLTGKKDVPTA